MHKLLHGNPFQMIAGKSKNEQITIPSNLQTGLVGMGQAVLYKAGSKVNDLFTFGCGPCIGVAFSCTNGVRLLAHLQPEANIKKFVQSIKLADEIPDSMDVDIFIHIVTVKSSNSVVAHDQRRLQLKRE